MLVVSTFKEALMLSKVTSSTVLGIDPYQLKLTSRAGDFLSARAYNHVLKVSRIIADIEGSGSSCLIMSPRPIRTGGWSGGLIKAQIIT
jgi:hypothetical protein